MRLHLDELKPGMRVAKPVLNAQNILLIKGGTDLTEKNILTLKTWGVTHVVVEGTGQEDALSDEIPDQKGDVAIEKRLKEKFADVLDNPVMVEIMRTAICQIRKRER